MTTAPDRDAPSAGVERRSGAVIFLVAMGLALATTSGAILTAAGTGELQDVVRGLSSPGATDPRAEQLQQTATYARLEHDVHALIDEISDLKAQRDEVNRDPAVEDRLARLDAGLAQLSAETARVSTGQTELKDETARMSAERTELRHEVARLRNETSELRAAQGAFAAAGEWRDQVDDLKASLARTGIGLDAMRTSLDASDSTHRTEIADIGRRVDRLEHIAAAAEATGSIAAPPPRRRGGARRLVDSHELAGWSVRDGHNGAAIIMGQTGTYEVMSGMVVPGIGRVSSIQRRANRWVVVTERGTIVQR
jgi:cell division protein FtsB